MDLFVAGNYLFDKKAQPTANLKDYQKSKSFIPTKIIFRKLDFFKDFLAFLKERKKWWLVPTLIILVVIGILFIFGGGSALAPFIYSLF